MGKGVKSRRACWIAGVLKAAPYRKPDRNARLKERLSEIARPGTGYRQAWMPLRSEFAPLSPKRVHRLWKELKPGRKAKYRKKRTSKSVPTKASRPNEVWSLDFAHDSCMNGTRLKILGVVDEFTRECLGGWNEHQEPLGSGGSGSAGGGARGSGLSEVGQRPGVRCALLGPLAGQGGH